MKKHQKDDSVEALLKIAGKRISPSEEITKEVYANVHEAWKQHNKKPLYFKRYLLAAASLFAFVGIYAFSQGSFKHNDPSYFGVSQKILISGQIETSRDKINWSYLKTNSTLESGDYIRTKSKNRILVELKNNNIFRLDENSLIQLVDLERIELLKGQIYVESNELDTNNKLIITTTFGSINHIGTQYNVKLDDNLINISVRKGKVLIHNNKLNNTIEKGFEISLDESGGYTKSPITAYDSRWQWTQVIAQEYTIQDKTVSQYLDWISRETGFPIAWNSYKSRELSKKIKLSGSIKGLTPIESLEVIMPTTTFSYIISETAIHISN